MQAFFITAERSWLEQGCKVGEQVIPLARNFNGMSVDVESATVPLVCHIFGCVAIILRRSYTIEAVSMLVS